MTKRSTCDVCGAETGMPARHISLPIKCAPCKQTARQERSMQKAWVGSCATCGVSLTLTGKRATTARISGRACCSESCTKALVSSESSARMARTNRKHASERMKRNNPMKRDESRMKMSATLRTIGHRPKIRGGNGRGLTVPQAALTYALGAGWVTEHPVNTKMRAQWFPHCFKVDIAHPERMIAVEIDGASHQALTRRAQDERKEAFLRGSGWTVFRFSNREVMERLEECARTVLSTTSK